MATTDVLSALLGLLALFALVQTLRIAVPAALRRARLRAQGAHARAAELRAEALLSREGFTILERQVNGRVRLSSNGELREFPLRADLLVSRGADRFIAEVKTGESAPSLENRNTRRQLLEYSLAFGVDGVLLVSADTNQIELVRFFESARPARWPRSVWILALVIAIGGAWLAYRSNVPTEPSTGDPWCFDLPRVW